MGPARGYLPDEVEPLLAGIPTCAAEPLKGTRARERETRTMDILLLNAGQSANTRPDLFWAWVTLTLSSSVAIGYAAIAFNWYFQIKVASPQAKAALTRLGWISVACALCGVAFHASDVTWGYLQL